MTRLIFISTIERIVYYKNQLYFDQTRRGDYKNFDKSMTVVQKHQVDKAYEVYLALYQGLTGSDASRDIYKQFTPDFFDLIVVDECHRGSARDDSAWREILEYFSSATQIGLTATPKETDAVSSIEYFEEPVYYLFAQTRH